MARSKEGSMFPLFNSLSRKSKELVGFGLVSLCTGLAGAVNEKVQGDPYLSVVAFGVFGVSLLGFSISTIIRLRDTFQEKNIK